MQVFKPTNVNGTIEFLLKTSNLFSDDDDEYGDETCALDFDCDIISTAHGFQLSFGVPNAFHKHIIGKKGEMKKRIENETRTQIKIPRQHEQGDIGKCFFSSSDIFRSMENGW